MSLLIEALKRAEESKRQQTNFEPTLDLVQEEHLLLEQPTEEFALDLKEEITLNLNDTSSEETLILDENSNFAFNFDEQVEDAKLFIDPESIAFNEDKTHEKTMSYNAEWLPLEEITPEETPFKKEELALKEKVIPESVEEKTTSSELYTSKPEKLLHIEEAYSKPWTKEEHAAAAAELQAASSTSLKALVGYLVLLITMLIILGGGYFFVSQKVDELSNSSFTTSQVTPLPSGGLAAKLAEIQKKSQQEQPITQSQTVITQVTEDKTPLKSTLVLKPEQNQKDISNTSTPAPTASQPQSTQTIISNTPPKSEPSNKRLKVEHNLSTPQKVDGRLQDAYQAYQQGNYNKAKNLYLTVLQGDKYNRDALLGLAGIAVQNQQITQARQYYQQVLQFHPKDSIAEMGLINLQETDSSDSENLLKNQLNQHPESPQLQFVLGNYYSRQHRWTEAQQAYFEAFRRNNQHPDYAYNLAVSLEQLGKSQAALSYYQRALKLSATHQANFDMSLVQQRISELEQP